ncbi:MAG: baseplate J/gp47 family protein, partial [Desulfobacteraceae bacterium]
DGTWSRFFTGDATMVLASIIATHLEKIDADFRRACDQPARWHPPAAVAQASHCYRLARKLDDWHLWLAFCTDRSGINVRLVIERIIVEELKPVLHELLSLLRHYPEQLLDRHGIDLNAFSPVWAIDSQAPDGESETGGQVEAKPGAPGIDTLLQRWFQAFYNAAVLVTGAASDQFEHAYVRQDHEPAMALFIAFAELFRQARQQINGFCGKHLNYYYRDLLQCRATGSKPDTAIVLLTLDGSMPEVLIPEGTEFNAGPDAQGKDLIYRSDGDLLVTDASVGALHTLCFEKNPLISPENELQFATGAWTAELKPLNLSRPPASVEQMPPAPMFGSPTGRATVEQASAAQLGLSIASPVLMLGEGERQITLSIEFDATQKNLLKDLIEKISQLTGTTETGAFYKLFKQIFIIDLTVDTGWYRVDSWHPDTALMGPQGTKNRLSLTMKLPHGAPPIVAYDPELHRERFARGAPIIRLRINEQSEVYPYSLLSRLRLKAIRIDVDVRECKDLLVYNHHGQINPSAPFQPFGPQPGMGAYLIIGSYEAAQKQLTAFDVCLEWDQVPGGNQGMQAYYRQYDQPYHPELFELSATVLRDGRWSPVRQSEQPAIKLFERRMDDDGPSLAIAERSVLETPNLNLHNPMTTAIPKDQYGYSLHAADGFFKFTLTHPEYAFGHKDYPFLLSGTMAANARRKKKMPIPNPPFTPVVKSISIGYRSRAEIDMEKGLSLRRRDTRERINLLHPLGRERIYPPSDNRQHTVIPHYNHAGSLMIGLDGTHPAGRLSLFFHIRPKPDPLASKTEPSPHWHYLSSNRWCALPSQNIVSDTTSSFKRSGIVTLDIPEDIDRHNTILPDDRYWLRVSVDRQMQTAGELYGVATQALSATWVDQGNAPSHLSAPLPAGMITEMRTPIAGIAKIAQPAASFKGRAEEENRMLATRVSERLRHKSRAIAPWDYERLILDRFPEIFKAKCFAGTSLVHGNATPGRILIVVVPRPETGPHLLHQQPMADAVLLDSIREFVARRSSPHATIEVSNPMYEQVQVRCAVKLHPGIGARATIKRVNRAINEYLSPWFSAVGYGAHFGWSVTRDDLTAYLLKLDDVDFVTRFSLLHIFKQGLDIYGVQDTGATEDADTERERESVTPKDAITPWYPWSIAVPMKRHFIETIFDYRSQQPQPAGVEALTIGETFILAGR